MSLRFKPIILYAKLSKFSLIEPTLIGYTIFKKRKSKRKEKKRRRIGEAIL